jgi:hypothetical protein
MKGFNKNIRLLITNAKMTNAYCEQNYPGVQKALTQNREQLLVSGQKYPP